MVACGECRAVFTDLDDASLTPPVERVTRLDQSMPFCHCEVHNVSSFSPGIILEDEFLIRILVAPQHMKSNRREPSPASLSDSERMGLSIFRERIVTRAEIRTAAEGLVGRARKAVGPKAGVFGVLRFKAQDVKGVVIDGDDMSAFCLYDTALEKAPSHAEAFQRVHGVTEDLRLARRRKLFGMIKQGFIPVDTFEEGFLADLSPAA